MHCWYSWEYQLGHSCAPFWQHRKMAERTWGASAWHSLCPFSYVYAAHILFFLFLLAHIQVLMKGIFYVYMTFVYLILFSYNIDLIGNVANLVSLEYKFCLFFSSIHWDLYSNLIKISHPFSFYVSETIRNINFKTAKIISWISFLNCCLYPFC